MENTFNLYNKAKTLNNNQLSGEIPQTICDLTNLEIIPFWANQYLYNNNLCPPYPECIEEYIGTQDTSNCP